MRKYYLAVDIGASSGRHILAYLENNQMVLEEIYRFDNGIKETDGSLCWELDVLYKEILNGLKKCKEIGKVPSSFGIDTWAVDFVLLDKDENIIGKTVGYRDGRTKGMDEKVYEIIPEADLYNRHGIQKQIFNSIYQLMAIKDKNPEYLETAETFLMVPDYFNFLLTGKKTVEYTNSTTTQLVSPERKDWDYELIEMLGYPKKIFPQINTPGQVLGEFKKEIQELVGFNCNVVLPATHDTASAVAAVPSTEENFLYISSGTWSLMGTERKIADCSEESRKLNFTNEGGFEYRFRYLKNIMGLWMIQSVRKEIGSGYSFAQVCDLASEETITSIVDCNDECFLAPDNMTEEVKDYCRRTNQQVPVTLGEIASVIYNSLADCYAKAGEQLEKMTGIKFDTICIVGGGANAEYLNQLTAKYTKKKVQAGPTEATAVGNIAIQMITDGSIKDLTQARSIIHDSFPIVKYE